MASVRCAPATTTPARRTRRARRCRSAWPSLEGGRHGVAFASGMASIQGVLATFEPGTRVLAMNDVYGGTYRLFEKVLRAQGYRFAYADLSDLDAVERDARATASTSSGWRRRRTRCSRSSTSPRSPSAPTPPARCSTVDNTFASPVPAAAARARRRHRPALDDQVHRRPLATSSAASRSSTTTRARSTWPSCRTRSARCPARWTASWPCAAPRRWRCACASTAPTPAGRGVAAPRRRRVGRCSTGAADAPGPRGRGAPDARLRRHGLVPPAGRPRAVDALSAATPALFRSARVSAASRA